MRTITPEETEKLFDFCRKHYVQHYDLQVELVDHLASAIEEQWQEKSELQFEEALHLSFKKFGITGFSKIKEQKQKELARKYNRLFWNYFTEFYRWPKMLMTMALTFMLFTAFQLVENIAWILIPYFAILVILGFLYLIFISPKKLKIISPDNHKFMLIDYLKSIQLAVILLSQLPISFFNLIREFDISSIKQNWFLFLVSLFVVSFNIAVWGYLIYIPQKVKQHFREQFPEFAM